PRWLVAQDTFRPPWFHRNIASEFMGLVHGAYDAKAEGFAPGGCSLHNCMTGHGPDAATFEKASSADLSKPDVITDTMALKFETRAVIRPTRQAIEAAHRQPGYQACWAGLRRHFRAGCRRRRLHGAHAGLRRGLERLPTRSRRMRLSHVPVLLVLAASLAACNRAEQTMDAGVDAASDAIGAMEPDTGPAGAAEAIPPSGDARMDGYAGLDFGMTPEEAVEAWSGNPLQPAGPVDDPMACHHLAPAGQDAPAQLAFMFEDGLFVR